MKVGTKKTSYLISKNNNGIQHKNMKLLVQYQKQYSEPFANKNYDLIEKQIQSNAFIQMIKEFKPFLAKKKTTAYTLNEIAMSSLTGIERGLIIENENVALKAYIRQLEENKKQALYGNIQTKIDVDVTFSIEYLYYIQKYGVPQDGIFDPMKLAECIV
jgi:hypothetical protein